jgi:hypothetical protein
MAVLVSGIAGSAAVTPQAPSRLVSLDLDLVLEQARSGLVVIPVAGQAWVFHLEPNPINVGAVWGVDDVAQGVVTEVTTFKGTANGYPARFSWTPLGVLAMVFAPDPVLIQPRWYSQPGAPVHLHEAVRWSEHPPVIPAHDEPPAGPAPTPTATPAAPPTTGLVTRFLIESDFEFYKTWTAMGACPDCWIPAQAANLNLAEWLFEEQVGLSFQISSQWACSTASACGYPALQFHMGAWLTAFRQKWEANADEPPHDLAALLIGTNLPSVSGVAFQAGVGTSFGYVVSELLAHAPLPGLGFLQYAVLAHEIGHAFDGVHEEADPVPPVLAPSGATGLVWTIMASGQIAQYQFSAGAWQPNHDNRARIAQLAISRLAGSG